MTDRCYFVRIASLNTISCWLTIEKMSLGNHRSFIVYAKALRVKSEVKGSLKKDETTSPPPNVDLRD